MGPSPGLTLGERSSRTPLAALAGLTAAGTHTIGYLPDATSDLGPWYYPSQSGVIPRTPLAPLCSTLGNGDHPLALPPCAMLVMSSSLHAGEWSVVSTSPSYSGLKPDFLVCLHPGYPLIIRLRSGIRLLGGSGPTFALPCTFGNVLRPGSNPRPSD